MHRSVSRQVEYFGKKKKNPATACNEDLSCVYTEPVFNFGVLIADNCDKKKEKQSGVHNQMNNLLILEEKDLSTLSEVISARG